MHIGVRLISINASHRRQRIWNSDADQAFLQSMHKLRRVVAIRVTPELAHLLGVPVCHFLLLQLPLYALTNSGDYWHDTFKSHLLNEIRMRRSIFNQVLYFRLDERGKYLGAIATYVDDSRSTGSPLFERITDATQHRFACKPKECDKVDFAGIRVTRKTDGDLLHHLLHCERVTKIHLNAFFRDFKSLVMHLSWQLHYQQRIACAVTLLAQVTDIVFQKEPTKYTRLVKKIVVSIKARPDEGIFITKLSTDGLRLRLYADASFVNNHCTYKSQLGYIIALVDGHGNACIIANKYFKSRRVLRFVLAAKHPNSPRLSTSHSYCVTNFRKYLLSN